MRLLLPFLLLFSSPLLAFDLQVRLFSNEQIRKLDVQPDSGLFVMVGLNKDLTPIDTIRAFFDDESEKRIHFWKGAKHINVKIGEESFGAYYALRILGPDYHRHFRIEVNGKKRTYNGNIRLSLIGSDILVVNEIDLEHYAAGVVESEGGHVPEPEYFKAQAVLARTFAIKNLEKHQDEGYNLKDDVTSQVYFSRPRYKHAELIRAAVKATKDTVVVTEYCRPILGVFHANSGGITTNAEDAWLNSVDYLKSKPDSFSVGVGSYVWSKEISKKSFYGYVASKLGVSNNLELQKALLNFRHEPGSREAYFEYKGRQLKLTHIRFHFNLKSTYFQVEDKGDMVLLKGYGYGHGVGMSQDGAIEMSRRGYSYRDILTFYFDQVELESVDRLSSDVLTAKK